ncbi:hypothetical protein C0585_04590 [Candidatus Woesearchaeota archaeon]|nr:MAG: hypothetical protein C0585_04590 [Candidatus Woesearchaeota archaeon]
MDKKIGIKLFDDKNIRVKWDDKKEEWYFSIVDVIVVLIDKDFQDARKYWNKLSQRLREEGNETVTNCHRLKLFAQDGKLRMTDVADTEQLLRIIQSIPSKKAEPFKLWLAMVGKERIDEIEDPEITINRALKTYKRKGYSNEWINQRLKSIEIRKELTDEWQRVGIDNPGNFAILTNEISKAWSGKTVKEYKEFKNLKKENLRDNMGNVELILNMLAEVSTKEISESENPDSFNQSKEIAKGGGQIAGNARKEIEKRTKKSVIINKNNLQLVGGY